MSQKSRIPAPTRREEKNVEKCPSIVEQECNTGAPGGANAGLPDSKRQRHASKAVDVAVSQRNATRLMKAAKACGVADYEIIYEKSGQIRFSVGVARGNRTPSAQNDFDRELG